MTQVIIDEALVHGDRRLLTVVLAGMALVLVLQVALTYARGKLLARLKTRMELDFFSRLFEHFVNLRQAYFDGHRKEDFTARFQENLKIRQALSPGALEALLDLVLVAVWLSVLLAYSLPLGLLATAFAAFFFLATALATPRLREMEDRVFNENTKVTGRLLDTLLGMQTVKLLSIERMQHWSWKARYRRALASVLRTENAHVGLQSLVKASFFAGQVAVFWYGAWMTFEGGLSIGQYVAFITIFTAAMTALQGASALWYVVPELQVTYERLTDVLVQEREGDGLPDGLEPRAARRGPAEIRLQDVRFRYATGQGAAAADALGERPVLDGVSLTIAAGEHVALMGRNGSGKSTLVKLLVGLYDHYDGSVRVGGAEVRNLEKRSLRRKVAMLPQDVYVFSGTILENVLFARPEATMDDVREAVRLAGLDDFVRGQYLGWDYMVGEGGAALSGGQRLKLAFARLFLRGLDAATRPDVVILDEASSAMDVEAERHVLEGLRTLFADATVVSIAHRLATVRAADRIVMLDEGRVAEQGTHEELLEHEGLYHRFMHTYLG